jgi:hypothetical protein
VPDPFTQNSNGAVQYRLEIPATSLLQTDWSGASEGEWLGPYSRSDRLYVRLVPPLSTIVVLLHTYNNDKTPTIYRSWGSDSMQAWNKAQWHYTESNCGDEAVNEPVDVAFVSNNDWEDAQVGFSVL